MQVLRHNHKHLNSFLTFYFVYAVRAEQGKARQCFHTGRWTLPRKDGRRQ